MKSMNKICRRHFAIGDRRSNYKLSVRGYYGDAGMFASDARAFDDV